MGISDFVLGYGAFWQAEEPVISGMDEGTIFPDLDGHGQFVA